MTTTRVVGSRRVCGLAGRRARLGLVGVVEDGHSGRFCVASTRRAVTLRSPVRERTITVRALDLESGEWREEQKRLAPVSGYDLVFSCPKSVSVLHALTEDEQVRREISEAHETAWQAALGYLEREACVVRRGDGGAIREHGEGFVAAAFRHRTSRAQDPHLHTHVIVANMTADRDGKWRALDGEAMLKTYRLAAGYLYEAQLRHELTQRLGVEWTEPIKGMGELAGVPQEAIRAFSTRRRSSSSTWKHGGTEGFAAAASPRLRRGRRRSRSTCRGCARSGRHARPSTASAAANSSRSSTATGAANVVVERDLSAAAAVRPRRADREAVDVHDAASSSARSPARAETAPRSNRCSRLPRSSRSSRASN